MASVLPSSKASCGLTSFINGPLTALRRILTSLSQNETPYTFTESCSVRATVTAMTHTHLHPMSLHITHEMTPIHFKSMCIGPFATSTHKNQSILRMHLNARLLGQIENPPMLKCSAPVDDILWHCWHRTSTNGDVIRLRSLIDLSILAHRYKDHAKEFSQIDFSSIEREAVESTFSDTAAILGEDAVPAEWNAWVEPGSQPYSRATAVLENRRQSQAIRHRIASASNPKEGLRRLWETGLPPKRWLEVNTGKTGWGRLSLHLR